MKKIKKIILLICIVSLCSCGKNEVSGNIQETNIKVDENLNKNYVGDKMIGIGGRNIALYRNLYNEDKNVLFSNAGIESVMEMARLASSGDTKNQIEKVYGINKNDLNSKAVNTYNFMVSSEINAGAVTKESYIKTIKDMPHIKAEIFRIKKFDDIKSLVKTLNDKIEKETNGQIKNVVNDSSYSDVSFKAELANVIHFLGKWKTATTDGYLTRNLYFKDSEGKKTSRKYFSPEKNDATLYENDDVIAFSLDYKEDDGRYKFVAMLPKDENKNLKDIDISNLNAYDGEYIIDTTIPCFEMENELELLNPISKLGVKDLFDPVKANLTEAFDIKNGNVYVSRVFQKAKIKVDEYGTEASAYTSMMMNLTSARFDEKKKKKVRYVRITLDRPFIYMIYDTKIEEPLFIGDVKKLDDENLSINVELSHQISIVDEMIEVDIDTKTKKI